MTKPLRTLIVDDNHTFVESAANFLMERPQIEVVGSAYSGQEALDKVEEFAPDLVLMDLSMPQMDGFEATRKIKARDNPPVVIILTLYDYPEYRDRAKIAGADGFVSKVDLGVKLMPLISELFAGLGVNKS